MMGSSPLRSPALDGLRGIAILAMLVDHSAVVFGGPAWTRLPGRLALPLFMLCAGAVLRPGLRRRQLELLLALPLAELLIRWAGISDRPSILAVFVIAALPLWAGLPALWLGLLAGVATASGWSLGLNNYEPALMLLLLCLGQGFARELLSSGYHPRRWLVWMGRHPVALYLGHLAALGVIARLWAL